MEQRAVAFLRAAHRAQLGELVERRRAVETARRESREASRMLTQVEKIYRLRQLARLEKALEKYGDAEDRSRYRELVQCEAGHLTP
jgi:hypothetical protein